MDNLADELELAHTLADLAGEVAMSYFDRGVTARKKADGTLITDADLAVERVLRAHIELARPHDAIHGEEFGRDGRGDRTWLIDPIDGTSFFAAGDRHWRIQLALQLKSEIVVSVVSAPALELRWWATRGNGSFEARWSQGPIGSPREMRISSTAHIDHARIAVWPPSARALTPANCAVVQASPLHLVDVLRCDLDGFVVACCHAWDHAPWILLIEEGGGRFTDWSGGRSPERGGGVYSSSELHAALTSSWPFI